MRFFIFTFLFFIIIAIIGFFALLFYTPKSCVGSECVIIEGKPPSVTVEWSSVTPFETPYTYNIAASLVSYDDPGFASNISANISLFDSRGQRVGRFLKDMVIFTGQENTLLYSNAVVKSGTPTRVEISLTDPQWVSFEVPDFTVLAFSTIAAENEDRMEIAARVQNNSLSTIHKIRPYAVVRDKEGVVVGVKDTYISTLEASTTKDISFVWPEQVRLNPDECRNETQSFVINLIPEEEPAVPADDSMSVDGAESEEGTELEEDAALDQEILEQENDDDEAESESEENNEEEVEGEEVENGSGELEDDSEESQSHGSLDQQIVDAYPVVDLGSPIDESKLTSLQNDLNTHDDTVLFVLFDTDVDIDVLRKIKGLKSRKSTTYVAMLDNKIFRQDTLRLLRDLFPNIDTKKVSVELIKSLENYHALGCIADPATVSYTVSFDV